jgi:hypothetical protein
VKRFLRGAVYSQSLPKEREPSTVARPASPRQPLHRPGNFADGHPTGRLFRPVCQRLRTRVGWAWLAPYFASPDDVAAARASGPGVARAGRLVGRCARRAGFRLLRTNSLTDHWQAMADVLPTNFGFTPGVYRSRGPPFFKKQGSRCWFGLENSEPTLR